MQDTPSASPQSWPALLGTAALFGMLAVVPLLVWVSASEFFEWPKLMAARVCAIAIVPAALWNVRSFRLAPLDLPILLYLALYAAATAGSALPSLSLGLNAHQYGGLASILAAASAYLAVRCWAHGYPAIRGLLGWVSTAATLIAVYALMQKIGADPFLGKLALDSQERVYSTFGQPTYLAGYLVLVIPVAVALAESASNGPLRLLGAVQAALMGAMLIATLSRGGWVGGLFAAVVYVLLRWKSQAADATRSGGGMEPARGGFGRRLWLPAGAAMAAVLAALALVPSHYLRDRIESAARWHGSTIETRWLAWGAVPEIASERPWLGWGPETFLNVFARYRPESLNMSAEWSTRPAQAHNEFLHLLATTGVLGLGAFLGLLAIWMWRLVWPGGRGPTSSLDDIRADMLRAGINAGVAGFLVQSAAGFTTAGTAPIFWAFLAMAQGLIPADRAVEAEAAPGTQAWFPRVTPVIRGVALGMVVLAGWDIIRCVRAESAHGKAKREWDSISALSVPPSAEAIALAREVVALDPTNDVAWRMLASMEQRMPGGGEAAREAARSAREANPLEAENHKTMGHVRTADAMELDPKDPAVSESRRALMREAAEFYRAACACEPSRVMLHFELAVVYAQAGDPLAAERACRETERLKPDFADGYGLHAELCASAGRADEARELAGKALAIDPKHVNAAALLKRLGN